MRFQYTLDAVIEVPDGSVLLTTDDDIDDAIPFCIRLPTGEMVRVETCITKEWRHEDGHVEAEGVDDEEIPGVRFIEGNLLEVKAWLHRSILDDILDFEQKPPASHQDTE